MLTSEHLWPIIKTNDRRWIHIMLWWSLLLLIASNLTVNTFVYILTIMEDWFRKCCAISYNVLDCGTSYIVIIIDQQIFKPCVKNKVKNNNKWSRGHQNGGQIRYFCAKSKIKACVRSGYKYIDLITADVFYTEEKNVVCAKFTHCITNMKNYKIEVIIKTKFL